MILVITEKGTIEGYTAAWVAKRMLKNECEIVQIGEGDSLPEMTGREVLFFGVSVSRFILEQMRRKAKSVKIFDNDFKVKAQIGGIKDVKINLKHTAARMAWEYLRADFYVKVGKNKENNIHHQSAPWIVDYTDSMERWRWQEVSQLFVRLAITRDFPETLEAWDELSTRSLEIVEDRGREIAKEQSIHINQSIEEKGTENVLQRKQRRKLAKNA